MSVHRQQCPYTASNICTPPAMSVHRQQCPYTASNICTPPAMSVHRQQCLYTASNVRTPPAMSVHRQQCSYTMNILYSTVQGDNNKTKQAISLNKISLHVLDAVHLWSVRADMRHTVIPARYFLSCIYMQAVPVLVDVDTCGSEHSSCSGAVILVAGILCAP